MSEQATVQSEDVKETQPIEEQVVPLKRFLEINSLKNMAEKELATIREAQQAAEDEEARKRGDFEKLLTEKEEALKAASEKAQAWENYQTTRREALLSKLPEDQRPIYDKLPLDSLEKHVDLVQRSITTKTNVTPGTLPTEGYENIVDAARDVAAGKITIEKYRQIQRSLSQ